MFKKLRFKFIAITMAMVSIVMALAFTVVCGIEYQRSYSVVQTALENMVQEAAVQREHFQERVQFLDGNQQSGMGPLTAFTQQAPGETDSAAADDATAAEPADSGDNATTSKEQGKHGDDRYRTWLEGDIVPPNIGRREGQARATSSLVPVAVYVIDDTGAATAVPEATTASIDAEVLSDATEAASSAADGFGTFESLGLHYYKTVNQDVTYLAFADTSYTDSWKTLALMLVIVGLGTLVVFFVISLFYSRWALKPVREAWDSQRQFVADASHDLKTPLTVILANASILLKHPDHTIASESQWIESTQVEAENMQGLVQEMLELAQIENGSERQLVREPVDLSDLVDGETLLFDSLALERGYSFECQIDEGITVLGDEKQLKKMVSTLVENAFKYVDPQGTVAIEAHRQGKHAIVDIRNSGSTISEQDLPHIFDRFYRTDKARTSGAGGFGLGLAIARGIAQQHGGDITCTSSESQGTTFTVKLPLNE